MPQIDNYTLMQMLDKNPVVHASTCVADLDYEVEVGTLTVRFQRRGTYVYKNFHLEDFVAFALSSSPGRYFNLYIRDAGYAYERVS